MIHLELDEDLGSLLIVLLGFNVSNKFEPFKTNWLRSQYKLFLLACFSSEMASLLFRTSRRSVSCLSLHRKYLNLFSSLESPISYTRASSVSNLRCNRSDFVFESSIRDFRFGLIHGFSTSSDVKESSKSDESPYGSVKNDGKSEAKAEMSWISLYLPKKFQPYAHLARLDKPIGTWLLAWPCMW